MSLLSIHMLKNIFQYFIYNYIFFHPYTLVQQIADGQRELIRSHSVKSRHFIGNTSMDAGLSFIMANHAKVRENDLVFDPFVGTGELIVSLTLTHIDTHKQSHVLRNLHQ